MRALIDNDILFKGACYGLLTDLVSTVCPDDEVVGILGSAQFVVPKRIERGSLRRNPPLALEVFSLFLHRARALEPSEDEQRMAADLELTAQRLGISLDNGESQLCAILSLRLLPLLLTGDKRAIAAIERLLDVHPKLMHICGRVKCVEQLFALLLSRDGSGAARSAVCAEPEIDRALTICFGCHSNPVIEANYMEGLQSYINDLRVLAARVLAP